MFRIKYSISSYKKITIYIFFIYAIVALTACQITPLYKDTLSPSFSTNDRNHTDNRIVIDPIPEKDGMKLYSLLSNTCNNCITVNKKYKLSIKLEKTTFDYAYQIDETANRTQTTFVAKIKFIQYDSHKVLFQEELKVSNSNYTSISRDNILAAVYGDADDELLMLLAQRIFEKIQVVLLCEDRI